MNVNIRRAPFAWVIFFSYQMVSSVITEAQPGSVSGRSMVFNGAIGNYPVTMHIQSSGRTYRGNYWYDRVGIPISISGQLTDTILNLETFSEDPEVLRLTYDANGNLRGVWDAGRGKNSLPVMLNARRIDPSFDVYALKDSLKPLRGRTSVRVEYEGEMPWPVGKGPLEWFMKQRISRMLLRDTSRAWNPMALMTQQRNDFFKAHGETLKDVTAAELEDRGPGFSWSMMQVVQIEYVSGSVMCVSSMQWQFTGGAHGNGASIYEIWDLALRKTLGLRDIISTSGLKALPTLLEKHFRKKYAVPVEAPLQEHGLFENRITEVTRNIFLTSKALIFSYTPYEIGPYAMGQIEIPVPLAELKPFLQPYFVRLLSLK
jgi:YD repeat-containing protein